MVIDINQGGVERRFDGPLSIKISNQDLQILIAQLQQGIPDEDGWIRIEEHAPSIFLGERNSLYFSARLGDLDWFRQRM